MRREVSRSGWVAPAAGAVAFFLVLGLVWSSPATASRGIKSTYGSLPTPVRGVVPDEWEEEVGSWVDGSARTFALGDPDKLIDTDLRLVEPSARPGQWLPQRQLNLSWATLGPGIEYEVRVAATDATNDSQSLPAAQVVAEANASVRVPEDGSWTVWVRPIAASQGRTTAFGPFLVDATAPPPPLLDAPAEPPGYRFTVRWSSVDDLSGVSSYEVERRRGNDSFEAVAQTDATQVHEDQVGNGQYHYRVRAVNGAGLASAWSPLARVQVRAPMVGPGPGAFDYGLHVNYTGFLRTWDLSTPSAYVTLGQVPSEVRAQYLGPEAGIETSNATLQELVKATVGSEQNTLRIARLLFELVFDRVDYLDPSAEEGGDDNRTLQRAGHTLDRGGGICGDLAVLYITLLRIAGVPARPIHGYLDNARSGIGGFHMWVEVYVGPNGSSHAWMTVDVSGVTGAYTPASLYAYFGIFNPDYLALGPELNYDRHTDGQWNTWARFRWAVSASSQKPVLSDGTTVTEYAVEYGRLFFDPATDRTQYVPCRATDATNPQDPCPGEPAPPGFSQYYVVKGESKKRIDYGVDVENLPPCLRVELRFPVVDDFGAVTPDQSAIYRSYVRPGSPPAEMSDDGWAEFTDGTNTGSACDDL